MLLSLSHHEEEYELDDEESSHSGPRSRRDRCRARDHRRRNPGRADDCARRGSVGQDQRSPSRRCGGAGAGQDRRGAGAGAAGSGAGEPGPQVRRPGVVPREIERSVNEHAARLGAAKNAIETARGKKAGDDEVEAGAEALREGVEGAAVSALAKDAPSGRSLAVPLYVIGGLVDRGLPSDDALARVLARLTARASDAEIQRLPGSCLLRRRAARRTSRRSPRSRHREPAIDPVAPVPRPAFRHRVAGRRCPSRLASPSSFTIAAMSRRFLEALHQRDLAEIRARS